jgi:hypothetical protein
MKTGSQTYLRKPTGNQPNLMPSNLQQQQILGINPQQQQMQMQPQQQMLGMPPNLQPQQMQMQPQQQYNPQQQMQMLSGSDQNFAEKLSKVVPPYLIQRIFANINKIQTLVMGGGWDKEDFKSTIKNEIQELTSNLKSPELQLAIKDLTEAADVPLTLFVDKFTEIIKKHIDTIINKLTNTLINLVGEIPGLNVFTNSVLAASNAVHVATSVTKMGQELVDNLQKFKNDMTSVMSKFNPPMGQQFGPQMMQPLGPQIGPQIGEKQDGPCKQGGGSNSAGPRNMKDAKKHLHHLHRKKNRTLRRIHHSIHEFLTSNRNKRSIKAKTKH